MSTEAALTFAAYMRGEGTNTQRAKLREVFSNGGGSRAERARLAKWWGTIAPGIEDFKDIVASFDALIATGVAVDDEDSLTAAVELARTMHSSAADAVIRLIERLYAFKDVVYFNSQSAKARKPRSEVTREQVIEYIRAFRKMHGSTRGAVTKAALHFSVDVRTIRARRKNRALAG